MLRRLYDWVMDLAGHRHAEFDLVVDDAMAADHDGLFYN